MSTILLAALLSAIIGALPIFRRSRIVRHCSALACARHMPITNIRRNRTYRNEHVSRKHDYRT